METTEKKPVRAHDFGRPERPLHQSDLKEYMSCPRRFRLRYIDGVIPSKSKLSLHRGRAIHAAIAALHTDDTWGFAPDVWEHEWAAEVTCRAAELGAVEEDIETEKTEWGEVLVNYAVREKGAAVIASEIPFTVQVGPLSFAGTIDQIRDDGDGETTLVDFKTNKSAPSQTWLARDVQFSIYWLAAFRGVLADTLKLHAPPGLLWYQLRHLLPYKRSGKAGGREYKKGDLRGDPRIPVFRAESDIQSIEMELRDIARGIRMGIFPMNPVDTYTGCLNCGYSHACKAWGKMGDTESQIDDLIVAVNGNGE